MSAVLHIDWLDDDMSLDTLTFTDTCAAAEAVADLADRLGGHIEPEPITAGRRGSIIATQVVAHYEIRETHLLPLVAPDDPHTPDTEGKGGEND